MSNRERYEKFCDSQKDVSVFSQSWWLDVVCGSSNWDVALVEKGGQIKASLPYYKRNVKGSIYLQRPPITPFLGPSIVYPEGQTYSKRLSWEKEVLDTLFEQLPEFVFFEQHFSPGFKNWLPLYWKGFQQTTRYTYVIDAKGFDDYLAELLPSTRRRRVKKANALGIKVYESDDIETFFALNKKTFARQGVKVPYSWELVKNLYSEGKKRSSVRLFFASLEGKVIAAGFYVFDKHCVYYLMGGIDPEVTDVGAMDLIQLKGIELALNSERQFDFEGSMMPSIEKYFRSFGAIQRPYFEISKTNSKLLKLKRLVKDFIK
ncbi:hypothetical protein A3765_13570 [Oleiphilus sp. HI0130]|nr:hypothetical protein A3765_13570 [Oleiphilus sp. HI0130]